MTPLLQILEHRIVAIVRGMPPKDIVDITSALYNGDHGPGITINEEHVIKIEKEGHNWHNPLGGIRMAVLLNGNLVLIPAHEPWHLK